MKSITSTNVVLACLSLSFVTAANAHDTWVEVNTPEVRTGNVVHVDLKLGNHGNDHRDFKLHSLITLDNVKLAVRTACGCTFDLKPDLTETAYEPKQGYWTTPYVTTRPGLHVVSHELDTLHGTIRAIKSSKTYFVAGNDPAATKGPLATCDAPLGHPLELVPITHPVTEASVGRPLRVRVLFEGEPLSDARVTFIPRGAELAEDFDPDFERKTDSAGEAEFTPTEATAYLIVVHHPQPNRSGDGYTMTHYGATLTVAVPAKPFPAGGAKTAAQ